MNYVHHALIGVGTASLGVAAAETLGVSPMPLISFGIGALVVGAGAIATDLDHPKSFISNSIPTDVIRVALVILVIPLLAGLAALLSARDVQGTLAQFAGLVFGVNFLRWSIIAIVAALGLMALSWLLYKSLHHRGPLHSLLFAAGVTLITCLILAAFRWPWDWGLAFGWGWLWHILADGLTKEGVPFFWPFNDKRSHTLPAWTCKVASVLLSVLSLAGMIWLVLIQISRTFA